MTNIEEGARVLSIFQNGSEKKLVITKKIDEKLVFDYPSEKEREEYEKYKKGQILLCPEVIFSGKSGLSLVRLHNADEAFERATNSQVV